MLNNYWLKRSEASERETLEKLSTLLFSIRWIKGTNCIVGEAKHEAMEMVDGIIDSDKEMILSEDLSIE